MLSGRLALARLIAFALPALLLAGAYVSQYGFGLFPCEMCWWQRYPHFGAVALAAIAFLPLGAPTIRLLVLLSAILILSSGLIGGFHAGVEYGWWEGLTACTAPVSGGDVLEAIMEAPLVRCDVAPWTLAGISLAGFNFLLSTAGAIAVLVLAWSAPTLAPYERR